MAKGEDGVNNKNSTNQPATPAAAAAPQPRDDAVPVPIFKDWEELLEYRRTRASSLARRALVRTSTAEKSTSKETAVNQFLANIGYFGAPGQVFVGGKWVGLTYNWSLDQVESNIGNDQCKPKP